MKIFIKIISQQIYELYLRSRMHAHARDLQEIAWQRENDFHAERILHREIVEIQAKLHSMQNYRSRDLHSRAQQARL